MLTLRDIEIPLDAWTEMEPVDATRRWRNATGDQFLVDFFNLGPDLPSAVQDIDPIRRLYRSMLGGAGGLVEVESTVIAGVPAILAIFKVPQGPTAMTYAGVVTIPFRDCSFVLKWQCPEYGMTGIRESSVFLLVSPPLDETGTPQGWAQDPYEPSHNAKGLRTRSDDVEWDARFPTHPLSRLRSYFATMLGAIRFSKRVAREPLFRPAK
jgi:hypothetical protein